MLNLIDSNRKRFVIIGMMVCVFVLCLTGCYKFNEWLNEPNDWFGEEISEELFEDAFEYETGFDLGEFDFTPSSPEQAK